MELVFYFGSRHITEDVDSSHLLDHGRTGDYELLTGKFSFKQEIKVIDKVVESISL